MSARDYGLVHNALADAAAGVRLTEQRGLDASEAFERLIRERPGERAADGAHASGPIRPPQAVVRAYLQLVARERWKAERPYTLGSLVATVTWWVLWIVRDRRAWRRHPLRMQVSNAMYVTSVAYLLRRLLVPPKDLHA